MWPGFNGSPCAAHRTGVALGRSPWVVKRTLDWLRQFRRLRVAYDMRANINEAILWSGSADLLACAADVCPGSAPEAEAKPLQ
jgi:hypothetical protein